MINGVLLILDVGRDTKMLPFDYKKFNHFQLALSGNYSNQLFLRVRRTLRCFNRAGSSHIYHDGQFICLLITSNAACAQNLKCV